MKIQLEIDDKYADTNLYLMWGMVPIARRRWTNQFWEIKVGECSQCGKCCKRMTEEKRFPFAGDGGCEHLKDNLCSLTIWRPFGCSVSDSPINECTVKWERVD